ncbi:MAG: hypothetical protein EOP02_17490, partial [Proteobacteria bacterium]
MGASRYGSELHMAVVLLIVLSCFARIVFSVRHVKIEQPVSADNDPPASAIPLSPDGHSLEADDLRIVACVQLRNELPYLVEWVEFHRLMGFTHLAIYDDGSHDSSHLIERLYRQHGREYVSYDRRHEVWTNVTIITDPAAKTDKEKYNWFSEVGGADLQRERVFDKNLKHDDFKEAEKKDAPQPFREVDKYTLTVRSEGRSAVADPIEKLLPPWYLPQAVGVLLPRLVPLDNPTGYLFASYS